MPELVDQSVTLSTNNGCPPAPVDSIRKLSRTISMELPELFYRGGVALFIGLLAGLQRERVQQKQSRELSFGGARTFPLIALIGYVAAMLSGLHDLPGIFMVALGVVAVLIGISYAFSARKGQFGMTTEMAAILVVLAGGLCYWGRLPLAVALGVATTALLTIKVQTRHFVRRLSREDVMATVKFAIISAIILPVLPNRTYGSAPFDVLNPHKVWWMVVLISGIGFLGYILIKLVGTRRGVGLTGLLGGLVSSTAVTLSFAQRSRGQDTMAKPFAVAILVSWAIMFVRVIIEVAVVNSAMLVRLWLPMTGAGATTLAYCAYLYFGRRGTIQEEEDDERYANPFELAPALTFGLLYGLILLVAGAAQMYFGDTGLYLSSLASGLADVDAITLSVAELTLDPSRLSLTSGARAVVLAVVSNTMVKAGIVIATGSPALRRVLLPGLLLIVASALGLLLVV